jgi:hypothetical protein
MAVENGAEFISFLGTAAKGLSQVATGTADLGTALGVATSSLKLIPGVGDGLSKLAGGTAEYTMAVNRAANSTANYGTSMANNTGQLQELTKNSRMSLDEYTKTIAQNSVGISGFGKNMDQSAKRFLEFGAILQESDVAKKMKDAGVASKDFNDLLAISMTNRRTLDMNDANAKKSAIEGTMQLAMQMDEIARITGKSAEQQRKDLATSLARADVQAELLGLSDQQRTDYMKMKTAVGPLGESIGSLADEIMTGGVRTKEGSAKFAALGPAGADFEKAVLASKNAVTQKDRDEAAAAMERAKVRITEYQASKEYRDQVKYDTTATGDAARKQFQENATINSQLAAIKNDGIKTEQQLIDAKKDAAKKSLEGKDPTTGKKEAGTTVGQGLNKAQQAVEATVAATGGQIKKLGDSAGAAAEKVGLLSKIPTTRADVEKVGGDLINKAAGGKAPASTVNYTPGSPPVSRADGSLGSVGKLIEDFGKGTPAVLHGKEGVVTENQLNGIIAQIKSAAQAEASKAAEGAAAKTASATPTTTEGPAPTTDNSSMTELATQLSQLNKMMGQLVFYSEQTAENTGVQIKATKGLSGNRLAF